MTAVDLAAVRDALAHSIKGPWRVAESDDRRWDCLYSEHVDDRPVALVIDGDTADCIARVLTDAPSLCDEVERLRDEDEHGVERTHTDAIGRLHDVIEQLIAERDTLAAKLERVRALADGWDMSERETHQLLRLDMAVSTVRMALDDGAA